MPYMGNEVESAASQGKDRVQMMVVLNTNEIFIICMASMLLSSFEVPCRLSAFHGQRRVGRVTNAVGTILMIDPCPSPARTHSYSSLPLNQGCTSHLRTTTIACNLLMGT